MKNKGLVFAFFCGLVTLANGQTYVNSVLGKYIGTVTRYGCPSYVNSNGALYMFPSLTYSTTVREDDSSAIGTFGEPWEIVVNADSSLRRYPSMDSVVYGQLFANDSIYLYVTVFGNPACHRIFIGFKLYSTAGLEDVVKDRSELSLWPNPATGECYLQSISEPFIGQPRLYDINGRELEQEHQLINSHTYKLSFEKIPNGIYLIRTETVNGVRSRKMIVQHE